MSGFRIGIDTGGTFTDAFASYGTQVAWAKTLTTPYDLGECFREVLTQLAARVGTSLDELLARTEHLAYSTTHGTNTLLEYNGPRLGLIISRGTRAEVEGKFPAALIRPEMIREVDEAVDAAGLVVTPLNAQAVRDRAEELNDSGARALVVAFRGADRNPANERAAQAALNSTNPDHSFGWVPIFISTDLSADPSDLTRLSTALVNAYIHAPLARFLYPLERELKQKGLQRPLLLAQTSGGVSRVAKSTAVHTFQSGPACGVLGSASVAQRYGWESVVCVDMGGTSTDMALIQQARFGRRGHMDLNGMHLDTPSIAVSSIAAGGCSIARVQERVAVVGPKSAGGRPGPACFDLGGRLPTTTDAELVLGRLDPDYFQGGQLRLKVDKARDAIEQHVARPLGISVEEAAAAIIDRLETNVAEALQAEMKGAGVRPAEAVLLSYGGAGPMHCCSYARRAGLHRIALFPFASVHSAFGCATSDVVHRYTAPAAATGAAATAIPAQYERMRQEALEDMYAEGYAAADVSYRYWLEVTGAEGADPVAVPVSGPDAHSVAATLRAVPTPVRAVVLESVVPAAPIELKAQEPAGADPAAAQTGVRSVYWDGDFHRTRVYRLEKLLPGNQVAGPAVIESEYTTCALPPGATLTLDRFCTALIELG